MQLMSWPMGRFGGRFGLLFEPARRQVLHSALGRFLDEPIELSAGLVEPGGTERVLPFTPQGKLLYGCEQFERVNSITFGGLDEKLGVRFELNLHSPFYPQNEKLCALPIFYVELRLTAVSKIRLRNFSSQPKSLKIFFRIKRPGTQIQSEDQKIRLSYDVKLDPRYAGTCGNDGRVSSTDNIPSDPDAPTAHVEECIYSLNPGTCVETGADGSVGLALDLPVTELGSGTKWRMIWAAHTADPVLQIGEEMATFRYLKHWKTVDAVVEHALAVRDDTLALSRRFEKLIEQAPLNRSRRHLFNMAFQSYLGNTFWCELPGGREWFSVLEGTSMYHSPVDVEYNISMLYFVLWPRLLTLQFDQWAGHVDEHAASGGVILNHDMGHGIRVIGEAFDHSMPVEENCNYLLLMQSYIHWVGDLEPARKNAGLMERLATYLLWTDRDGSGFPSEGTVNTLDDGSGAVQYARKQSYLAIKRVAALTAAADVLGRVGGSEAVIEKCRTASVEAVLRIEKAAWLGDHYAVSIDRDAHGLFDSWSGEERPTEAMEGWDDYSIYTTNGLLLPLLVAQPLAFQKDRLETDLLRATHETMQPYGCAHTSSDHANIWISSNLWRDYVARYLRVELHELSPRYWDMLVFSNTGEQSLGYVDTYIGNELAYNPRGATSFGWFLTGPRLQMDLLDGHYVAIDPDRHCPQRWPLLPLADWEAGKIPICVVDPNGHVRIESEISPVKILGGSSTSDKNMIG